MTSELTQLRDELAKSNTDDANYLRGIISYLIKDKPVHNLLIQCLNAGVLQDFFQEATHDSSFINRCRTKLIEDFFINESAADKAISYCTFLTVKEEESEPIPYFNGSLWGFCDKYKNILIDCKYKGVERFSEGRAIVYEDGMKFIDITGKTIIINSEEYSNIHDFKDGFAKIESGVQDGQDMYINKDGKVILRCTNDIEFHENLAAICKKDTWWGFMDISFTEIIPCIYEAVLPFCEGFSAVKYWDNWIFIDKTGKRINSSNYETVYSFSEGIARVKKNGKLGLINKLGYEIVSFIYDDILAFNEGLAGVRIGERWGFIDLTGKETIPCRYENLSSFVDGAAGICRDLYEGLPYGIQFYYDELADRYISFDDYDLNDCYRGKTNIFREFDLQIEYNEISENIYFYRFDKVLRFINGVARVPVNQKWSLINKSGEELISTRYDDIRYFCEGIASVKINNKWGFININGIRIADCIYDEVFDFKEDMAWVKKDDLYGFIDKYGKEVVPCKYDVVRSFNEGAALVVLYSKYGFIDKSGREFVPCKYDSLNNFNEGLAEVKSNGKWGFIDKTGNEIIPCKYDSVNSFSDGLAFVVLNKNFLYIDKIGTEYWDDTTD